MGNAPPPSGPDDYPTQDTEPGPVTVCNQLKRTLDQIGPGAEDDGLSQTQQIPQHQQHHAQFVPRQAFASQLPMIQTPVDGRPDAFNMAGLANALPQTSNFRPGYPPGPQQHQQHQRFSPATSSPPMMPPISGQYHAPHSAMSMVNPHFYMPPHSPAQQYYGDSLSPNQQLPRSNLAYYPNQLVLGQQKSGQMGGAYYFPQAGASFPSHQGMPPNSVMSAQFFRSSNAVASSPTRDTQQTNPQHPQGGVKAGETGDGSRSNVVRGPPRKPRQSGHAIWIGNLPPQTDLMSLVHHVCKEAPGLESLFLISKSNCAFANFKDEKICAQAQQKLHDSKFQTVRLVSRLRKNTVEGVAGVTAPTGPAASSGLQTPHETTAEPEATDGTREDQAASPTASTKRTADTNGGVPQDKFFILKSLTVEDLELSVRTGIWATQLHNEEALNSAFAAVDNVYLVFSANKSGEYFGYARMISPINEDPAAAIQFAPKSQAPNDVDLPKAIPTEATDDAPRGRIIDDSARGTIFWEAEHEDTESAEEEEENELNNSRDGEPQEGNSKSWGKPFNLEWLATSRLPFYRTRGLRNPWNSNREVKIARDGTELEPAIGRKLIGLFNRVQSPGLPMIAGYPPMRPPY